jgi:methylmalonyl-CoA/ethylmalonyl-CoA epimerase
MERATSFYKDKLGLKHLFSVPPKMAFFDCDGIRLMLGLPERADLDHPSSILYFKVEDIHAAHEALNNRGVHFETKPMLIAPMQTYDLWLAEFRDSEDNVLALMCEKAK